METRILLQQILSCVAKPGENNNNLMDENHQKFMPEMPRARSENTVLQNDNCVAKIDFDEEIFPDDPDDEISSDDTDIVEAKPVESAEIPRGKGNQERLRIIADLHTRRVESISSVRSITDEDSFDSAL